MTCLPSPLPFPSLWSILRPSRYPRLVSWMSFSFCACLTVLCLLVYPETFRHAGTRPGDQQLSTGVSEALESA